MKALNLLFVTMFFAVLAAPAVTDLLGLESPDGQMEKRTLASRPPAPRSLDDLVALPEKIDAFVNDHFGLRGAFVELNNRIRFYAFRDPASPKITAGRDGYLFFNSHDEATPNSLINFLCGNGIPDVQIRNIGDQISRLVTTLGNVTTDLLFVVVPTKSRIYNDKLPEWLLDRCRHGRPPVIPVLAQAARNPGTAERLYHPLSLMVDARKKAIQVYPRQNFHWTGVVPRRVAETISEQKFGMTKKVDYETRATEERSDIQHLLPGVPLVVPTEVPLYAKAGVNVCANRQCFVELGDARHGLRDVSRYTASHGGRRRLLILSDSFGKAIAGYFAQYFGEVWHVSTSQMPMLGPGERASLLQTLFVGYRPDTLVLIYHDGALMGWPRILNELFPRQSTVFKPPVTRRSDPG